MGNSTRTSVPHTTTNTFYTIKYRGTDGKFHHTAEYPTAHAAHNRLEADILSGLAQPEAHVIKVEHTVFTITTRTETPC